MRKSGFTPLLLPFLVLLLAPAASSAETISLPWDEEARLLEHIAYLANDARDGRGIGTPGLDSSAQYLQHRFEEYGLEPLFDGSYRQTFNMGWGAEALPGTFLAVGGDTLTLGGDLLPLGFSSVDHVSASVLFAGYGISAPEYNYDDYADIDATGKIVILLQGEPAANKKGSLFAGTLNTDHSQLRTKAINARNHGAVGLLIVNDTPGDTLPTLRTDEPYRDAGLPVVVVTRAGLMRLFKRVDVVKLQRSIDVNEAPRSMDSGETATLAVELHREEVPVANVGAEVPGSEVVLVIGAHYDHLGYGQMGSNDYGVRAVHNGADDNASGTAVLLEMARWFAQHPPGPTLWFVAFTGEEVGLVGSNWFVNHPPESLDRIKFMLNLDMVGRTQQNKLTVYGVHSAKGLAGMATAAAEQSRMVINQTGGGYGASDQTSFYIKGIPVLHLLGALHEDYHTAKDDVDKINGAGTVGVLDYAIRLVDQAAKPATVLEYQAKEPPAAASGGQRGNISVSMGTIPDFSQPDSLRGLRIQGVRTDGPADKAGLTGMDVLVKMDDVVIDNIYDFTYALKKYKPGDTATVVYLRDGQEHTTQVTFAASTRRH